MPDWVSIHAIMEHSHVNFFFFFLQELEEHTWSILHNTNLNRKQGKYV